jgi:hypothetical protein
VDVLFTGWHRRPAAGTFDHLWVTAVLSEDESERLFG